MALTIVTGVLNQGATIAAAALAAYMVGQVATGATTGDLRAPAIALGAVVLVRAVMAWAEMWVAHDLAYRILADLRGHLYTAIERLAPGYLIQRRSGDVASAAMADIETAEWFYAHTVGSFVVAILVPCFAFVALGWMHWLLPLVLLPFALLVATVPLALRHRAARQGETLRAALGNLNADVVDGVQGLRELVSFGQQRRYLARLEANSNQLVRSQLAHGARIGLEQAIATTFMSGGMLSVVATAAVLVSRGQVEPAYYPVAITLAIFVFGPIHSIASVAQNLGIVFASANRAFRLLNEPPPVIDAPDAHPPAGPIEPTVVFDRVTFSYPGSGCHSAPGDLSHGCRRTSISSIRAGGRTSAWPGPLPATRKSKPPRGSPSPTTSSWTCRTATKLSQGSAVSRCPGGNVSGSPSPGRC
jgi:ATP-binding cassette subfamily B protein